MRFSALKKYITQPSIIILIVCWVFIFLCARIPQLAEAYMRHVYPIIATCLSFVSQCSSFSLLDLLILIVIGLFIASLFMLIRRKWTFTRWLKKFVLSILYLIVWFYLAWGIGYFRQDFFSRYDIAKQAEDKDYFEHLVIRYIDSLNRSYTPDIIINKTEVSRIIETSYESWHQKLQLPYPCGMRRTKYTFFEPMMTRMGVAGYFDPFLNEVQVNDFLLSISYPFTLAHEKAHQFGIARESECNFYASVICTSSNHPLIRYSGYLETTDYLLGSLRRVSPEKYREIYSLIDSRIQNDYKRTQEHWMKALSPGLSKMHRKVYDSYLKTNQQASGIRSYSEMVELLVAWEMAQGI